MYEGFSPAPLVRESGKKAQRLMCTPYSLIKGPLPDKMLKIVASGDKERLMPRLAVIVVLLVTSAARSESIGPGEEPSCASISEDVCNKMSKSYVDCESRNGGEVCNAIAIEMFRNGCACGSTTSSEKGSKLVPLDDAEEERLKRKLDLLPTPPWATDRK